VLTLEVKLCKKACLSLCWLRMKRLDYYVDGVMAEGKGGWTDYSKSGCTVREVSLRKIIPTPSQPPPNPTKKILNVFNT
jgi:hypothetical protein